MADSRATPLEITRRSLKVLHSMLNISKNINREYEGDFGDAQAGFEGQKIGPTLNIRKPVDTTVRTGWSMSQQDVTEAYKTLTIDTVRGIDMKFNDADMALSIDDFAERYINNPMKRLAAKIEQVVSTYMYQHIYNVDYVASTYIAPTTSGTYLDAAARLKENLVPQGDSLYCVISPRATAAIVGGLAGQYNPQGNISTMYEKGQMSKALGLDWYESNVLPAHTTGSRTNTTPVVATFSTSAPTSIGITGGTTSGTYLIGDTFTIAGVYSVNYETKATLSTLQKFVVTANATGSSGAVTLTVSPALIASGPTQNVSAVPTATPAVVFDGGASTVYQNEFVFHQDSFAFATVPLYKPKGLDIAESVTVEGISGRFLRGYDIANARLLSRFDVFFGICELYPQWAERIIHV